MKDKITSGMNRLLKQTSLFAWSLVSALCIGLPAANASHVVGSDITYKCTGTPGIFEVTLVIYRNCDAGAALLCSSTCGGPCAQGIRVQGADPGCEGTTFFSPSLDLVSVRDVNINLRCPTSKNTCNNMNCVSPGTYTPGVERYEFKGFVNIGPTSGIPANCCNVRFSWDLCCRNGQIATGSANQQFYMEAVVNRCLSVSPCNSSPELSNDPFAVMCGGENFVFNNGAIDPDYDSLTFAFTPCLQGANQPVSYILPWAYDKPMPWSGAPDAEFPGGIHCDPETGDITFTPGGAPVANWYGVMAIAVKQWKTINGVPTVIGTTRRDMQMVLLANCQPNNIPRFVTNPPEGSNPNAPKYKWETHAGEQLCFTVTAKDTDLAPPTLSDTTFLSWNAALANLGATFLPTYNPLDRHKPAPIGGPREDQYQFCWTPDDNRASNTPYYFTISALDSRCPNPGRITRAFSVKVRGRADLSINKVDLKCGTWQVGYTNNKPSLAPSSVLWQISSVPGDYSMSQNPYTSTSTTPFNLTFKEGGKYLVMLQTRTPGPNGVFCTRTFYDTIQADTIVKAVVRDTIVCAGSTVQISATAKWGALPYTYRWYNSIRDTALTPLNAPNFASALYTVGPGTTRYYTIQVRDINQCRSYDSVMVAVKSLPVGLLYDSSRMCYGDTFTLDPGDNFGNIKKYLWNTEDTTRTILATDSGQYIVELTDTFNCKQTDTMMLYVNRRIFPDAGQDTSLCYGDTVTLAGYGGQLYQWKDLSTGQIIQNKGSNNKVRVWPTNTASPTKYELIVYSSYPDTAARYKECFVPDTVQLTVKPLPILTRPPTTQACRSESMVLLPGFANNQPGGSGVWTYPPAPGAIVNSGASVLVDSLQNIPSHDTVGSFVNWIQFKYTAPASFGGCSKRDSASVTIYGVPPTDGGPKLIWCENGGIYAITAVQQGYKPNGGTTAEGEDWSGAGIYSTTSGLNKRWFFDPLRPGVLRLPAINIMTYKYTRTYPTGIQCSKEDTVQFNVTRPPAIDAGSDVLVCNNEPVFNISQRSGATITPATGKTYWTSATAGLVGTVIVNGQQDFNAPAVNIPAGSSQATYKMYVNDTSTNCLVRDSMTMRVARVPSVRIVFDNQGDSMNVCQNTKQVYMRVWATNNTGVTFEPSSSMDLTGSSSSYSMNTNPGVNSSRTVFNSTTAAPGMHLLKVKYTDNSTTAACSNSDMDSIYVQEPPSITALTPQAICTYDSQATVSLQQAPNAGYGFIWSTSGDGAYVPGTETQLSAQYRTGTMDRSAGQVQLTATTLKKVMGTNGDQCAIDSSGVILYIDHAPHADVLSENTDGCVPLTSNFGAAPTGVSNAQFLWEWQNEPGLGATDSSVSRTVNTYNTQVSGRYHTRVTVSSTNHTSCSATSGWRTMNTRPIPYAEYTSDPRKTTIAKPFFNFINSSSVIDNGTLNYLWNLGPGPDLSDRSDRYTTEVNPTNVEYAADTACQKVTLRVTTQYGCVDSTEDRVCIEPDITVFIPNAFRPDGENGANSQADCIDGTPNCNKVFKVVANGYLSIEIFIYNRWGQLVFSSTEAETGWNGRMLGTGEFCPQEVYVYQVTATSYSGKKYKYSGSVTLLR